VYLLVIWCIFPVSVCCTKKNLAALLLISNAVHAQGYVTQAIKKAAAAEDDKTRYEDRKTRLERGKWL
jgi:hypothetical protein